MLHPNQAVILISRNTLKIKFFGAISSKLLLSRLKFLDTSIISFAEPCKRIVLTMTSKSEKAFSSDDK